MKKSLILMIMMLSFTTAYAGVDEAVNNFFSSITTDVNIPTVTENQSAMVLSGGGFATRSQVVNLQPMTFTPPSFGGSCGNLNFYSGSLTFMTNTDQLLQFLQNTLMTAGITAAMTALKAATPNIAGTLQSMMDAAQKMLGMFNNSCQLGMALGNAGDKWVYDRLAKSKSQSYTDSADASSAEVNSTVTGSSGNNLAAQMNKVADSYHAWVEKNANMNPFDSSAGVQEMAVKYGSVLWKGMQSLHLYSLPGSGSSQTDVENLANLVISLTGDLIIYSPTKDGTGFAARTIPPAITDVKKFMTSQSTGINVYNCTYFSTDAPGECQNNKADLSTIQYPIDTLKGGVIKTIQTAMSDIQDHIINNKVLTQNDLLIIAITPVPLFAIAQTLDDIGMAGQINNVLQQYSPEIAFEILQKLVNISLNLAKQAGASRSNKETVDAIRVFTDSISNLQSQVNSYAAIYVKKGPIEILEQLNSLRSYSQNLMSPMIMQKVNYAKSLSTY